MSKQTPSFFYQKPFPVGDDRTEYRLISSEGIEVAEFQGEEVLKVNPETLTFLSAKAMHEIAFRLRAEHLKMVAEILKDSGASDNDREVALTLLKNAEVASFEVLPMCQDTGTAIILGKKGQRVWTGGGDEEALSKGVYKTYTGDNLRYSQSAPLSMFSESNTGTNLPAQIDLMATDGQSYDFLFIAKGGGSANKSYFFQESPALLTRSKLLPFCLKKMGEIGTAACPPYHVAFVIGGTSAEATMKTVKLASAKYYDDLPTAGNAHGQAFRDIEMEQMLLEESRKIGFGAQFGGKYFALDVRVIRLPRHGASLPIGLGVSCSADRNVKARIDKEGVWLEQLETDPQKYIPQGEQLSAPQDAVQVDLNRPMEEILAQLSKHPVTTKLSLSGAIIVARDKAHMEIQKRLDRGESMPDYFKDHPIYYAGPAKTPEGSPTGSFGPTTAGRMDTYVAPFQEKGGSMVMLAKGNRSEQVKESCKKHGGFYLGSTGGPAAILAKENILGAETVEYPEFGMEAIRKIEVKNFPAYILVDDKGNDFFDEIRQLCDKCVLSLRQRLEQDEQ